MTLEIIHLLTAIILTLAVDIFALYRYFKWHFKKACAMSMLINIVSLIAVFLSQRYFAGKLPTDWFYIYHLCTSFAEVFLLFVIVSFTVKVIVEALICSMFDKSIRIGLLLTVVILMNLIATTPGVVYDFMRGRPVIPKSFQLVEHADWLNGSEGNIFFFNAECNEIVSAVPGTDVIKFLAESEPYRGYRISADEKTVITLGRTNSIVISTSAGPNGVLKSFSYGLNVEDPKLIDIAHEAGVFAVCSSNIIGFYSIIDGSPRGESITIPAFVPEFISFNKKSDLIVAGTKKDMAAFNRLTGECDSGAVTNDLQLSWVCSLIDYINVTNSFVTAESDITVILNEGIKINRGGLTEEFNIAIPARYLGIGFLDDGQTFLFQLGREILALNVKTKRVGRLYEGVLAITQNKRYQIQ